MLAFTRRKVRYFIVLSSVVSILLLFLQALPFLTPKRNEKTKKHSENFVYFVKHVTSNLSERPQPALARPIDIRTDKLGEWGEPAELGELNKEDQDEYKRLWNKYGINQFLSQKISPHRVLKDPRPPDCLKQEPYDYSTLPSTSVIIVFYNEGWSTFIRTIYSVLHNTPDMLLHELILVDDFSDHDHLKQPLEDFTAVLPKIRLIRTKKREGLIRARLLGLEHAKGEVTAFVDCHCECTVGWLEGLLVEIVKDNATLAVPVTDDIDSRTFQYYYGYGVPSIGGFTWQLFFHWRFMSDEKLMRRKDLAEPIPTPTISGGLFAVNRKYFMHIGSYDNKMEVWGGENVEVSFRTWMCGGRVVVLPCSHIGHVSRDHDTYQRRNTFWQNVMRVAEVWLDDYKRIFYHRLPVKKINVDVEERKELRKRLKCHDFKWYLDHVYPEQKVPEDRNGFFGSIRTVGDPPKCLDLATRGKKLIVGLYTCHGLSNQFIEQSEIGEFRFNHDKEMCVTIADQRPLVTGVECSADEKKMDDKQMWYFEKGGLIRNKSSGDCMKADKYELLMTKCDSEDKMQRWDWLEKR